MRRLTWLFAFLPFALLWAGRAHADVAVPTPGEESKKLGFYVGKWIEKGRMRADPAGEWAPLTGRETCRWLTDKFAVRCDETLKSKAGSSVASYEVGYNAMAKRYVMHGMDNGGNVLSGEGRLEGNQWTWTVRINDRKTVSLNDGKTVSRWQYVFRTAGHGARAMVVSVSTGENAWAPMREVTESKK